MRAYAGVRLPGAPIYCGLSGNVHFQNRARRLVVVGCFLFGLLVLPLLIGGLR